MHDPEGSPRFLTTRWSLVLAAGGPATPEARAALEVLCHAYWYPLYAFARRKGEPHQQAQDLVQGFFTLLLDKERLQAADRGRGRFRNFLLSSFSNFSRNEHARASALKRGGGAPRRSLSGDAEGRYAIEPTHEQTPEQAFLRDWALELLNRVLGQVRETYAAREQEHVFDALKATLTLRESRSYAELGAVLGITTNAVKVAVHRLRDRYRRALRAEIEQTVEDEATIEDEIGALFEALASG